MNLLITASVLQSKHCPILLQLLQSLELPVSPVELDKLKEVLAEATDTFALDDLELGCTNLVRHTIHTENHTPIKQRPYRTAVIYRE